MQIINEATLIRQFTAFILLACLLCLVSACQSKLFSHAQEQKGETRRSPQREANSPYAEKISPTKISSIKKSIEESDLNMENLRGKRISREHLRGGAQEHYDQFLMEHGKNFEPTLHAVNIEGTPLILFSETTGQFSAIEVFNEKGEYLMKYSGSGASDWSWDR